MKRINQVMVVLALFSVLMSAYATEEGDIASCFIHLPAGYEGIDGTWIGGNTEYEHHNTEKHVYDRISIQKGAAAFSDLHLRCVFRL